MCVTEIKWKELVPREIYNPFVEPSFNVDQYLTYSQLTMYERDVYRNKISTRSILLTMFILWLLSFEIEQGYGKSTQTKYVVFLSNNRTQGRNTVFFQYNPASANDSLTWWLVSFIVQLWHILCITKNDQTFLWSLSVMECRPMPHVWFYIRL